MTPMTRKQRKIADKEREGAVCARYMERGCDGRLEVSHPLGRKKQPRWAWIWCCTRHHRGDLKNEKIGRLHAYLQATEEMIMETYPKTYKAMLQDKKWLKSLYKQKAPK